MGRTHDRIEGQNPTWRNTLSTCNNMCLIWLRKWQGTRYIVLAGPLWMTLKIRIILPMGIFVRFWS